MKHIQMKKISTKSILKKIFKGKSDKEMVKKVKKKKVTKIKKVVKTKIKKVKKVVVKKNKKVLKKIPNKLNQIKKDIHKFDLESSKYNILQNTLFIIKYNLKILPRRVKDWLMELFRSII